MSPILQSLANASAFGFRSARAALPSFESIATTNITTNTASVTFSSIPATFAHLQLRVIGRTDRSGSAYDAFLIRVNNDTTAANYTYHYILGEGASASAGQENGSYGGAVVYRLPGATAASNIFGATITDILDYTSTNKNKTLRSIGATDLNGSGEIYFGSNLWLNTSAITSLVIVPRTGTNFVQYSQFALYGIRSA